MNSNKPPINETDLNQHRLFTMDTPLSNTPSLAKPYIFQRKNLLIWLSRLIRFLHVNYKSLISAVLVMFAAILWYYPMMFLFLIFLFYSIFLIGFAVIATIYFHYLYTTKEPPAINRQPLTALYDATRNPMFDPPNPIQNATNLPLIFSKTIDLQLQQIIEYISRDFMTTWLRYVVMKPKFINDIVREDLWNALKKFHERAKRIDASKVLAVDMVNRMTVHLEKIRIAESRSAELTNSTKFSMHSYLADEEQELQFLRKLCEIAIILLLPRGYSMPPLKFLLCEILSYKILYPMIKMLTSSDYINQKIVQNIENHLAAAAINKRSCDYAASFEDFLKIINNSSNLEELYTIRKSILNDLMHATTIQNLQRAKGIDLDNCQDHNLTKSEISAATKLKRYVQQLSYAKELCEKNLEKFSVNSGNSGKAIGTDLSVRDILNTATGRRYLTLFLEPLKASALVGFYVAVEELKNADESAIHQLGTDIYYTYIRVPKPEIQVDKNTRKLIETFLLGDSSPNIFFEIQSQVYKTLKEKYYQPFLLSEQYRLLKDTFNSKDYKDSILLFDPLNSRQLSSEHLTNIDDMESNGLDVITHTTYARRKLEDIQERIGKKSHALEALKNSVKPDSKVLKMLEKEMEMLKVLKQQTEAHLSRTDAWTEHLGKWKATLQSIEVSDEKESLQFMILVHVDEDVSIPTLRGNSEGGTPVATTSTSSKTEPRLGSISSGWMVMKSLHDLHELQRKLKHVNPKLKSFDLPTNFKFFFLKNDKSSLEKAKQQTQKFLNMILLDEQLSASEAIYTFLSPGVDNLKHIMPSPRKSKFSLSTLFKSDNVKLTENSKPTDPLWALQRDHEDISAYLDSSTTVDNKIVITDTDGKDSIAEPLYALMGEIFDMGGVFKWLRKSLISFVQITYGRTINRQIRETVSYFFEESMLHFYFSTILKSFWPGGVLASSYPQRSDDIKEMTASSAKTLLMANIPEILCNLVGAQAAKRGVLKVFHALQNPNYNKQLFYDFLEILMIEFFPEVRQLKIPLRSTMTSSSSDDNFPSTSKTNPPTQSPQAPAASAAQQQEPQPQQQLQQQ